MKKIKLKLSDRISFSFILLFLILMIFGTFFIIYFLNTQDTKNIKNIYSHKIVEVNKFLDKIETFSRKYESITLEFKPKIDEQGITYNKPFEPGADKLLYIIRVRNNNSFDEIALNTLTKESNELNFNKLNNLTKKYINTNIPVIFSNENDYFSVIRINKHISGNIFDIYVLKNITSNIQTYKNLTIILLIYSLLALIFIIFISTIITKKILKPVNNIILTANSISTNDLTIRIDNIKTGDELDELISIINNMLERLNIAFDNQSKFISDVSHELRTPLAIIKGYAELIQRHGRSENKLINESVDLIINEAINMKNLIDKLLFLAKGDANTVKINIETFDSTDFINQVYKDALFFAKEHNLVIEKNMKYTLFADKSLLLQAIRTIIENSVKYSPKNTNIFINSKYDTENKEAVISIRDEGIGIDEKYLDKIFERFYRVDESRTKETGGTGLGLSIVKKIMYIHNGRVEVKSKINEGSEFILYIPSKIITKS